VLLEQGVGGKVGSVTTGRKNDRSVFGVLLTILLVLDTDDLVAILENLADLGLFEDLDSIRGALCEVLELPISLAPWHQESSRLTFSIRAYVIVIPGN